MAESMDHSRAVIEGSDEAEVIFCEPCEQDGRQTEAEGFCVDCSEYLCGQCYKNHKLFKAFRSHVLQDKHTMPQTVKDKYVQDLCVTTCNLHVDKVIEYFCLSCNMLGCTTCITLNHRQCDKVEHIPKLVKAINITDDLQTYVAKVDVMSHQVQDDRNTLNTISAIADDMRKVAKTELKKYRKEINKFFDNLEKEMENNIDEIHASNTTAFTKMSATYHTMYKDLKELKTKMDVKKKAGQHCEAFIAMKQSARNTGKVEKQFQSLQAENKILQYELLPSPQIKDMMGKVTEICRIETVTPEIHVHVKPHSRNLQTTASKQLSNQSDILAYTTSSITVNTNLKSLTLHTEIHVNTDNDKKFPVVTGATLTHQYFAIVADHSNNTIKAIDLRKKTVVSELKLENAPWCLAEINEDKVAIGTENGIQIISVSKSGLLSKTERRIRTNNICFGIAYSSGNFIVATVSCVEILNMDGKVLSTIKTDSDGGQLFTSCYGIVLSKDHNTIYVSDYDKESVTSLRMDGHIKAIYKDKDLKKPWDLTVDDEDNVYVSSSGNCIHQLSPECKKLQVFQDVTSLCVFHTNNKLYVGSHENSIRIYDLQ